MDTIDFDDKDGNGEQFIVIDENNDKNMNDEENKSNLFNLDSHEIQDPIPKKETDSKFLEPNEETNLIGIKQSLVEGIKKELPLKTITPKATKQIFKRKEEICML